MLQTLKNAWNTKEIRSKILFTLFILLIYRIGTVIPVPFVESNGFAASLDGTILQYMDTLSGGSLGTMTLFALGVQPYINASIIIQLLAVVFPKLGELAKNDKKKMNYITRVVTVILAIVTALGYYFLLRNGNAALGIDTFLTKEAYEGSLAWLYAIVIIACYTAGASLIMFLAERINEKGIGNGISLILFANIIASVPSFVYNLGLFAADTYSYTNNKVLYASLSTLFAVLFIAFMLALTAAVTAAFYFILSPLGTANIFISTVSVTTSFIAVYLTFRRSPFFALAYAANDVVLIIMWLLAVRENASYISVVVCFAMFLVNDIYGFISWLKMGKRQGA